MHSSFDCAFTVHSLDTSAKSAQRRQVSSRQGASSYCQHGSLKIEGKFVIIWDLKIGKPGPHNVDWIINSDVVIAWDTLLYGICYGMFGSLLLSLFHTFADFWLGLFWDKVCSGTKFVSLEVPHCRRNRQEQ
jgi:hypothetical protein